MAVLCLLQRRSCPKPRQTPPHPNHPPCHGPRPRCPHGQTHSRYRHDLDCLFLLAAPGEYCRATDNHPLCLGHVTFTIGHHKLNTTTASAADLHRAMNTSLTFDHQKNRKRGKVIDHARSGHSTACPVYALAQRCIALRQSGVWPAVYILPWISPLNALLQRPHRGSPFLGTCPVRPRLLRA